MLPPESHFSYFYHVSLIRAPTRFFIFPNLWKGYANRVALHNYNNIFGIEASCYSTPNQIQFFDRFSDSYPREIGLAQNVKQVAHFGIAN